MGKGKRTANTVQIGAEVDTEIGVYFRKYCDLRRETQRAVLERALRREFKENPEIPKPEPLPPLEVEPAPKKKK